MIQYIALGAALLALLESIRSTIETRGQLRELQAKRAALQKASPPSPETMSASDRFEAALAEAKTARLAAAMERVWPRRHPECEHVCDEDCDSQQFGEPSLPLPAEPKPARVNPPAPADGETVVVGDACQSVILASKDPGGDPYDRLINKSGIPDLLALYTSPHGADAEQEFHAAARKGLRGPELIAVAMEAVRTKRMSGVPGDAIVVLMRDHEDPKPRPSRWR